ncbi:MAG: hypothetical protein COU31_02175 [Candidatus Magasanikbacteria bacterium CG10_big_fil_rev_8_21_14_0_10_40_10]|uniref:Uncharacterized protein n=1 Tax=Candidatus Magasanikbacteria bacterium CG10_big_fil_rev_8_21_14_0_10_40_10 TaxID=1974648 RepID=A0A2M6W4C0_9BACT|nr:MAG: hypothetical protein COU31_02175 [Candidatus Magasanikbacteria bacterium CG10_big_fil_rev_8_21_14_0_10_40_10]
MKKVEINDKDRATLSLLNEHFKLKLAPEDLETDVGIKKVLDRSWKENKEKIHDLGIPMLRLAKMYARLLKTSDYLFGFIPTRRRDCVYCFDFGF